MAETRVVELIYVDVADSGTACGEAALAIRRAPGECRDQMTSETLRQTGERGERRHGQERCDEPVGATSYSGVRLSYRSHFRKSKSARCRSIFRQLCLTLAVMDHQGIGLNPFQMMNPAA
ncbi:hypothetical protein [Burkholderia ubonensis]|uniref:hypothetical protein n=1 Tax=Burkholderia ubonensis TaxID=101571 RepID=UPI0012F939C9|nr:hypothetical protein [Burkholderia ubonensis]